MDSQRKAFAVFFWARALGLGFRVCLKALFRLPGFRVQGLVGFSVSGCSRGGTWLFVRLYLALQSFIGASTKGALMLLYGFRALCMDCTGVFC